MKHSHVVIVALLLIGLITACLPSDPTATTVLPNTPSPSPSPLPSPSPSPTLALTSTPTPIPPKEFTVCQALEPNTLFVYGGPSRAARNVLAAIYDGPIDTRTYQFHPVILPEGDGRAFDED